MVWADLFRAMPVWLWLAMSSPCAMVAMGWPLPGLPMGCAGNGLGWAGDVLGCIVLVCTGLDMVWDGLAMRWNGHGLGWT
jgi:hypothetical protein